MAAISTLYGLNLIKCGIQGETLMPGTNFTYLPRWFFVAIGLLMQLPLVGVICYNHWLKNGS